MSSSPRTRTEELQIAIAARLKKVCVDWPRERFDEMVSNLAFITVKYEGLLLPSNSVSTEELLAQMKALRQRSVDYRGGRRDFTDLSPGF